MIFVEDNVLVQAKRCFPMLWKDVRRLEQTRPQIDIRLRPNLPFVLNCPVCRVRVGSSRRRGIVTRISASFHHADKNGGFMAGKIGGMKKWVDQFGILDLRFQGSAFTWTDKKI